MTKRIAYKRIGLGFVAAFIIGIIGILLESDSTQIAGLYVGHGIHALGVSNLAEAKGYKGGFYFVLTLFFSLIIGLTIVWILPDKAEET